MKKIIIVLTILLIPAICQAYDFNTREKQLSEIKALSEKIEPLPKISLRPYKDEKFYENNGILDVDIELMDDEGLYILDCLKNYSVFISKEDAIRLKDFLNTIYKDIDAENEPIIDIN